MTLAQLIRELTVLAAECEARGRRIDELEAELKARAERAIPDSPLAPHPSSLRAEPA